MPLGPEDHARETIDRLLSEAGWVVQSLSALNLHAGQGVAVRELQTEHGPCDYMLFVDRQAVGVVEAKKQGEVLSNHEFQPRKYSEGMPAGVPAPIKPLPFLYLSTGVETRFASLLDPDPRYRNLFYFHQPETLAKWLANEPIWLPAGHPLANHPASFRLGLTQLPELHTDGLWPAQRTAILNLEKSFAADRPRALIQMATGSGKTFTAVSSVYRLIKHAGARRTLLPAPPSTSDRA
jgi:type I restriction enzyme R subunit